jgi:membrane protein
VRAVPIARKVARVLPDAAQRFFSDRCPQQAAGISYRVLFSIVPLAIVLVAIFGLVLQDESVRNDVVDRIVDWLPVSTRGRQQVEDALTNIATPASAAGFVGLIVFVWAATGMMTSIRQGLEVAMGVKMSRPMARGKLVDLVLIVGAAVLVLVTVGLTLLGELLQRVSGDVSDAAAVGTDTVGSACLRLATFALMVGVVLLIYRFVPTRGISFRDGLAGAIVTALLLQLISFLAGVIYDRTTNLSVVYGSLTAALVFLYSTYLYSSALLLGAEVAAAWSRPWLQGGPPVLTQVKRGILGLFVSQPQDDSVQEAEPADPQRRTP